jgi:hypothetical protein
MSLPFGATLYLGISGRPHRTKKKSKAIHNYDLADPMMGIYGMHDGIYIYIYIIMVYMGPYPVHEIYHDGQVTMGFTCFFLVYGHPVMEIFVCPSP